MRVFALVLLFTFSTIAQKKLIQLQALPSLSPDGKELVFNWNGDLWKVSSEGGLAETLTAQQGDDTSAHFSPDGKRIAFVSSREGYRQAYVMASTGGAPQRIGFMSEGYSIEGWYPDGQSVLVSSVRDNYGRNSRRLYRLPIKREAEVQIFNAGVNRAVIDNSGQRILFTREGEDLYRKGYKGPRTTQIWLYEEKTKDFSEILKGDFSYTSPMWSENEEKIYYVSDEDGTFNIWQLNLKSKEKKQLTQFKDDGVILPSISRDGSKIVFRQKFDLHILDTDSEKSKKLEIWHSEDFNPFKPKAATASTVSSMNVSSDGLEIVFASGFDLWVMDKILKEPVRITDTEEIEAEVLFSKDNQKLYCVRDDGVSCSIVEISRVGEEFWWQTKEFTEKVLFKSPERIYSLKLSPGGKYLSYIKGTADLYIYDLENKEENLFLKSWDAPYYSWSPDDKWISYAIEDNNFNNDVWLKKIGSDKAYNVSQHPEYDGYPAFSPDGKHLAFSTSRNDEGYEIAYVSLSKESFEESSRDRTLKKALDEMKKRKVKKAPAVKEEKKDNSESKEEKKVEPPKKATVKKEDSGIKVDLVDLNKRVRIFKNQGDDYAPFWSPDSKRLAFSNSHNKKTSVQYLTFPDVNKAALFYKDGLGIVRWVQAGDQLFCTLKGVPAMVSKGKVTTYAFKTYYSESKKVTNRNVFRHIWRQMRDNFYDDRLNNKNWDEILSKYEEQAANAVDATAFDRVVAMLLGELNASHLGFRSSTRSFKASNSHEITAHLGVKFDSSFKGRGLKIAHVIKESNASKENSLLKEGELILSIDTSPCNIKMDLTELLNGPLNRDILLEVQSANGEKREVVIRPHSYSQIRSLLYKQKMARMKSFVHEKSDGKMGYLHVSRMLWPEFNKFKEEVFKEGNGREGLIIDVRDNGGGFTADHLISVLMQPRHAITVPRNGEAGYPFRRQVYLNWYKPIVVLCNQNSYSNAEIFAHAIKSLDRGKLIGVPTAGGVISTGSANILGKGTLRMPFRGWFIAGDGEDMEMNGAVPDVIIWPRPGELESGKDVQLEKALEVLAEEVRKFEDVNRIKLKKASERK